MQFKLCFLAPNKPSFHCSVTNIQLYVLGHRTSRLRRLQIWRCQYYWLPIGRSHTNGSVGCDARLGVSATVNRKVSPGKRPRLQGRLITLATSIIAGVTHVIGERMVFRIISCLEVVELFSMI